MFHFVIFVEHKQKTNAMTNAQAFIQNELDRRMNFVNDPKFREMVRDQFVALGVTPEDWNTNKAFYYMMVANEFCAIQNAQA